MSPSGALSNGGSLTAADGLAPWQTISSSNNTYTFFGYGRYKLTDTIQASLQLNYGYFTGKGDAQSFQQLNTSGVTIKSDNAFIPASVKSTLQSTGITSFHVGTINGNNYPPNGVPGDNVQSVCGKRHFAGPDLQPPQSGARRRHPGRHAG